jgi:nucleotide-binding universal stress UspA family protein
MSAKSKILVPTDFSTGAKGALKAALRLARSLGAEITLLNVFPLPNYILPDGTVFLAEPPTVAQIAVRANEALGEIKKSLSAEGLTVHVEAIAGAPAEEIVRFAREGGFEMIVMGTHGRTGLAHLLIGSVAERVVRLSPCPVLTVRGD